MSIVRLLPAWLHAVADYAVGLSLIVIAFAVGGPDKAVLAGVVVGAVILAVSMLTRYPLGVIKVLPFTLHSAGDYLAAGLLIASPFVLGFFHTARGLSIVYLVAGIAVLGVSLITNYQYSPTRRPVSGRQSEPDDGRADAGQWYRASAQQRSMPVAAPEYPESVSPDPIRPISAPGMAAGRSISLRDAIAANREQEAS